MNKKIKNATEEVVDNIKFKSRLEAFTYNKFKENKINIDYEKHKYILQDSFYYPEECYVNSPKKGFHNNDSKTRMITYTPDFVNTDYKFVIECKGFATPSFDIKFKMFKKLMTSSGYSLYVPRNQKQVLQVLEIIKYKMKW